MAVKQIICIRRDLNMRKGKMVAQGAHASMAVLLEMMRDGKSHTDYEPEIVDNEYKMTLNISENSDLDKWLRGDFTKICVSVKSEEELEQLFIKAKSVGLPTVMIVDKGLTEFDGIPTKTCIAIGPADSDSINTITGHLPLL